ncbi:MAG: DUF1501 domain-containing protein, partial [Pseudomonadota bacterium]
LLVLVELKGGNDGLNSVIPYADSSYYRLRPRLGIARDQVVQLDAATGLHPALKPLWPLWQSKELAIVQGVGYPKPNLSHFRSIEIWDTASDSDDYLEQGWLSQVFGRNPPPRPFAADGVVVGSSELGPLAGGSTRAIALANTEQFLRQAKQMDASGGQSRNPALAHLLKVEGDIRQAAIGLRSEHSFRTDFPKNLFGNNIKTAAQVVAANAGVAVIKLSHNGFDTHSNQLTVQARLLAELAEGLTVFRSAMQELNRWDTTLVMTYAEFGRRPQENGSGGTDHGTANAHFVLGGRVQGGLYGERPALTQLESGNLRHAVDFRQLYATAAERWWGLPARSLFGGRYAPLEVLRA